MKMLVDPLLVIRGKRVGWVAGSLANRTVRFAVVGGVTTSIDIVLFWTLAVASSIAIVPANIVSYVIAATISFLLNRLWTFAGSAELGVVRQAARFVCAHVASLLLSTVLVTAIAVFLEETVAKVVSIALTFAWNRHIASIWIFGTRNHTRCKPGRMDVVPLNWINYAMVKIFARCNRN